jgi:hypothetical protein
LSPKKAPKTIQEKTNDEEKIQPAETGVEPSTSASPNKVKKKVGRPTKTARPVHPSTPPAQTEQVAQNPNPPNPTHHPPTDKTNENPNNNEYSTPGNKFEQLGKRIRRRHVRYANGADETNWTSWTLTKTPKKLGKTLLVEEKPKNLYKY